MSGAEWLWLHLARTVLHCTVAEAKQRLTRLEYLAWQAEFERRPWGDEWSQVEALAASMLAPWNKRIGRRLKEFFPKVRVRRLTDEQIEQRLTAWQRQNPGRFKRGGQHRKSRNRLEREQRGADVRSGGGGQ